MLHRGYIDKLPVKSIVHLGACSATTEKDADYLMDNNYSYSKELAEYSIRKGVRFIYASSAATYGSGDNGYSDNRFKDLEPLNCYGLTKHLFDLWVLQNGYDKLFTGIKFFNVFGPNEYAKGAMASMVYKSYKQIKKTGKAKLFKSYRDDYQDGKQMRDFIYIKDVVDVMSHVFDRKDFSGIYNLGTGKARTWDDLMLAVFKALNIKPEIEYIDMPSDIINQYQYFTQADMEKLEKGGINYDFMELEDSVADYVQNYLEKDYKYI